MQGIAKRVQDLLTSQAPITQSTVMVPASQPLTAVTRLLFYPASHSSRQLPIVSQRQKTLAKLG